MMLLGILSIILPIVVIESKNYKKKFQNDNLWFSQDCRIVKHDFAYTYDPLYINFSVSSDQTDDGILVNSDVKLLTDIPKVTVRKVLRFLDLNCEIFQLSVPTANFRHKFY